MCILKELGPKWHRGKRIGTANTFNSFSYGQLTTTYFPCIYHCQGPPDAKKKSTPDDYGTRYIIKEFSAQVDVRESLDLNFSRLPQFFHSKDSETKCYKITVISGKIRTKLDILRL